MALKIELKPGERIAVNGAVLTNGDRRAVLSIENRAAVLRERDIMQAHEATTPARRVYLPVMLMALDPAAREDAAPEFEKRLLEFAGALSDRAALELCLKASAAVANGDYYRALGACRALIDFEEARLAHVA